MSEKFDAVKLGWTLKRAESCMTIIPDCNNCKSYESDGRSFTEYCRKHDTGNPYLCSDWSPQKGVVRDAAYSRMAYLQLIRKEANTEDCK